MKSVRITLAIHDWCLLAHLVGALPLRRANRMFNSFRELLQQLQYINFWKVNSHGCEARLLDVARTNLLGVQLFCFPWYHMITGTFFLQWSRLGVSCRGYPPACSLGEAHFLLEHLVWCFAPVRTEEEDSIFRGFELLSVSWWIPEFKNAICPRSLTAFTLTTIHEIEHEGSIPS